MKLCIDNASDEALRDFVYRPDVKELVINGDYVDHLVLPDGVEWVYVEDLALKSLVVPDSVIYLHCPENRLRTLELPAGIENVTANKNKLRSLTFRGPPTCLSSLDIRDNRFAGLEFDVPPTLTDVDLEYSGVMWSTMGHNVRAFLFAL